MSCQQVPTAPAFNPYPRSVQVGEFEVAIGGGIWVAIGVRGQKALVQQIAHAAQGQGYMELLLATAYIDGPSFQGSLDPSPISSI